MKQLILKPWVIERIKSDQVLFGEVAAILEISIRSLLDLIPSNPPRLANASVLALLRERLNVAQDKELLEEKQVRKQKLAPATKH